MDDEQSQALGFAQLYPMFSSLSMQRLWILNDLFVQPHARKRGVATGLIDQSRQLARETGAKGLQLETATDNFTAQRLYEQTGFTRVSSVFYYLPTRRKQETEERENEDRKNVPDLPSPFTRFPASVPGVSCLIPIFAGQTTSTAHEPCPAAAGKSAF